MSGWATKVDSSCQVMLPAAERFLSKNAGCSLDSFAPGEAGVCALSELLLDFAEKDDATELQTWEFVEGTGALLSLLLAHHMKPSRMVSRNGAHRLQLGAYGWFDPFGAIEHVLGSDDVKRAFARRLALAEAEAEGGGPVARVQRELSRQLDLAHADLHVSDVFEYDVVLSNGTKISLEPVVTSTISGGMGTVSKAVSQLIALLTTGTDHAEVTWEQAHQAVFPRLIARDYLEGLGEKLNPESQICVEEFGADVVIALVFRYPDRVKFLSEQALAQWRVTKADAQHVALENLMACSVAVRCSSMDTKHGSMLRVRHGDGLDAARLLLPDLYWLLSDKLGAASVAVGIPHRDSLLAVAGDDGRMIDVLRERVRAEVLHARHRITEQLWRLRKNALPCLVSH